MNLLYFKPKDMDSDLPDSYSYRRNITVLPIEGILQCYLPSFPKLQLKTHIRSITVNKHYEYKNKEKN